MTIHDIFWLASIIFLAQAVPKSAAWIGWGICLAISIGATVLEKL